MAHTFSVLLIQKKLSSTFIAKKGNMARLRRNLLAVKNFLCLPDDPSQPLTRFDLIRLKNWMLIGIYLANAISYILMTNLIFRGGPLPSAASLQLVSPFGHLFRTNSIFFIIIGISVTQFVIANFAVPLREIIQALKDVRSGNFDRKVIVMSNDEIGYTGDVSGHGISSALLMAAVRSALRQRSSLPGSTAEIISDVNRQLVADFGKEPIYDSIRDNSSLSANEILNAMIESLKSFQQGAKIEDDITLVIIKICN
jgi:methyl-accepting chemotaxis protein